MRFVISNKLYDTDKMEYLAEVKKWYECTDIFTVCMFGEGGEDCETTVLCDLWRKWKNAKQKSSYKEKTLAALNDLYYELIIDKMGYPKDGKYYRSFSEEESACIKGVLQLVEERIKDIYGE